MARARAEDALKNNRNTVAGGRKGPLRAKEIRTYVSRETICGVAVWPICGWGLIGCGMTRKQGWVAILWEMTESGDLAAGHPVLEYVDGEPVEGRRNRKMGSCGASRDKRIERGGDGRGA